MMVVTRALMVLWMVLVSSCASYTGALPTNEALLRLAPSTLGRSMVLQQHLVVTARGRSQALDVVLEVDPQELRLAVLGMNQTAVRISWDGAVLAQTRANWLPDAVRGEHILSDLQLVWWPEGAVRSALPLGWTLESSAYQRRLLWNGDEVTLVQYMGGRRVDLTNRHLGYQLQIDSVELDP